MSTWDTWPVQQTGYQDHRVQRPKEGVHGVAVFTSAAPALCSLRQPAIWVEDDEGRVLQLNRRDPPSTPILEPATSSGYVCGVRVCVRGWRDSPPEKDPGRRRRGCISQQRLSNIAASPLKSTFTITTGNTKHLGFLPDERACHGPVLKEGRRGIAFRHFRPPSRCPLLELSVSVSSSVRVAEELWAGGSVPYQCDRPDLQKQLKMRKRTRMYQNTAIIVRFFSDIQTLSQRSSHSRCTVPRGSWRLRLTLALQWQLE